MTNPITLKDLNEVVQESCVAFLKDLKDGKHHDIYESMQGDLDKQVSQQDVLIPHIQDSVIQGLQDSLGKDKVDALLNVVDIKYLVQSPKNHRKIRTLLGNVKIDVKFELANRHLSYFKLDKEWVMNYPVTDIKKLASQVEATQNRVYYQLAVQRLLSEVSKATSQLARAEGVEHMVGYIPQYAYDMDSSGIDLESLLDSL